ncbi:hypothetical protein Tco_0587633 [Tanacetum coccineum]
MFLNVDQLENQLDKEEFQEIGSMAAFKVLETQFQMFIKSRITSIDEREPKHKEKNNKGGKGRVNERQMQTTEDKVDSSNALDASLVDTESSETALKEQDTSSRSGNDHTEQPEFNNGGKVDQNVEQCHDTCP